MNRNVRSDFVVFLSVLAIATGLMACRSGGSDPDPLFRLRTEDETGIDFKNVITESDSLFNMVDFYYVYNGGGVAIGDINNDSLPDLYFSGNMVPGRLYLNQGGLRFKDITQTSGIKTEGWSTGVSFVDINADGFLDLYVCRAGPYAPDQRTNLLYVNNRDLTFSEQSESYGIADTSYSTQGAFFDYDKDGDLDLYVTNHSNQFRPNQMRPLVYDGTGTGVDRLFRNEGNGHFSDVSRAAGVVHPGLSLGMGIGDLNGDGWEDVYVSNDFMIHDFVYMNHRNGTFEEKGAEILKHHSFASMGLDLTDINNDGLEDIMVLDMRPPDNEQQKRMSYPLNYGAFNRALEMGYHPQYWRNVLQLNNGINQEGRLTFSDVSQLAGVEATDWSWSPLFADYDNDGWRDLWITNGYRRGVTDLDFIWNFVRMEQQMGTDRTRSVVKSQAREMYDMKRVDRVFRNRGDLTFEDVAEKWGIAEPTFSNGGAYADLDNDGDLDIVVNMMDAPAAIYENRSKPHSYLKVAFKGKAPNTFGLGADLRLYCNGRMQSHHHSVVRGYQSSMDYVSYFGLGSCRVVDSLRVVWPDAATQVLRNVPLNRTITVNQKDSTPGSWPAPVLPTGWLSEVSGPRGLDYVHVEEPYNDYSRERLLPHQESQLGPGMAVGDVNGDGLDDLFIGGAFGHSGSFYLQKSSGTFISQPLTTADRKYEEDMGAVLFDADNDGDQDLYVASGSNEYPQGAEYLRDRFYLNDGKGHFELTSGRIPDLRSSKSCVLAADYDRDGDLDLFVGGRVKAPLYPQPGISYLLRNDNGKFTEVTDQIAPGLKEIGMVSAGLWTDFNNDRLTDLMVIGEFMAIRFFENTGGHFRDVTQTTGLNHTGGWWNSITGGDFDRDGDTDYVLGNLGLNTRFRASVEHPVSVYGKSFDWNGDLDPIVTSYIQGEEYPIALWDDLVGQLPGKKLLFSTYESYARARFADLFSNKDLEGALILRATRFENSYLENLGGGKFRINSLPVIAQIASMYGVLPCDLDGDGFLDILASGNSYGADPITGRLDASIGWCLRGNGKGKFVPVRHQQSGFFVDGDGKSLVQLIGAGGSPMFVAAQNNGPVRAFSFRSPPGVFGVQAQNLDASAEITFSNGNRQKFELYYGDGYLSQNARFIYVPRGARSMTMIRYDGTTREIKIPVQVQ